MVHTLKFNDDELILLHASLSLFRESFIASGGGIQAVLKEEDNSDEVMNQLQSELKIATESIAHVDNMLNQIEPIIDEMVETEDINDISQKPLID
jgi:hypothetical protein